MGADRTGTGREWLTYGRMAYCYLEDGLVHKVYRPLEEIQDLLPANVEERAVVEAVRLRGEAVNWTTEQRTYLFGMEVGRLAALLKYDNFPDLVSVDVRNLELVMTYAGPDILTYTGDLPSYTDNKTAISEMFAQLQRARIPYRDVKPGNICWDGQKLRLVDFSWGGWNGLTEAEFHKYWKWSLQPENRKSHREERLERLRAMRQTGKDILRAITFAGLDTSNTTGEGTADDTGMS